MLRNYNFKLDTSKINTTKEGYLDCVGSCARIGVQVYSKDGKPFKEFRSEEEVFNEDSLESHKLQPVTIQHPNSLVDCDTFKDLSVGITGTNPRRDGDFLKNDFRIMDGGAINWIKDQVENGKEVEISMGYNSEVIEEPGIFRDEKYDAIQKNIRINHAALCDQGSARAGRGAKLKFDSEETGKLVSFLIDHQKEDKTLQNIIVSKGMAQTTDFAKKMASEFGDNSTLKEGHHSFEFEQKPLEGFDLGSFRTFNIGNRGISLVFAKPKERKDSMKHIKKDQVAIEGFHMDMIDVNYHDESETVVSLLSRKLDEAVAKIGEIALQRETAKTDSEKAIAEIKDETSKIKAKADQLEENAKKKDAEISELTNLDSDRMQEMLANKAEMKAVAEHFNVDIEGKTDHEIRIGVISAVSEGYKADGDSGSETYVAARYDQICSSIKDDIEKTDKSKESLSSFLKNIDKGKNDNKETPRAKAMERSRNMWKSKAA